MGIQLVWENEARTILRHIYDGQWTAKDFIGAVDRSRALLLKVGHPVDLIIDMRTASDPPPAISHAYQYADRNVPDNQHLVVVVHPPQYMKTLNQVVGKIAPRAAENRHLVMTMEEAFDLIVHYRAQL